MQEIYPRHPQGSNGGRRGTPEGHLEGATVWLSLRCGEGERCGRGRGSIRRRPFADSTNTRPSFLPSPFLTRDGARREKGGLEQFLPSSFVPFTATSGQIRDSNQERCSGRTQFSNSKTPPPWRIRGQETGPSLPAPEEAVEDAVEHPRSLIPGG